MRIILILLLSSTVSVVEARMYQWTESGVKTTQLSGKPPAWYRSSAGGPRVFVFDKGRLIDDTAVEVSDEVRQRMRQEAFILAEEDRQKAKEKIAKAEKLKEKYKNTKPNKMERTSINEREEKDSVVELLTDVLFPEDIQEVQKDNNIKDKSVDELRAIIQDWENSQTESAKQALE
jgi:hypothetical protein